MTNQPYKTCPSCQTPAVLDAPNCANCGHAYQTQFAPPQYPGQTQAFYTPGNQPSQQPMYPPPTQPIYPQQQLIYPPQQQSLYQQQQSMYPPPPHPVYAQPPYFQPVAPPGWIQVPPGTHSVTTAVLLSIFCIVGAGQFYNKQVGKGLVMLVVAIIAAIFTLGLSALIMFPICIIDTVMIAGKLNRGVAVRQWEFF